MNRRTVLALTTVGLSAVALSAGDAMAQQRSLKDQLVGTWTLVSTEDTAANGTKREPWGANPKGIHIFEAGGRYATLGGNSNRPKFKPPVSQRQRNLLPQPGTTTPTLARGRSTKRTRPSPGVMKAL